MSGDWAAFFTAEVGASAALAGLVFVALSINLRDIIVDSALVGRAAQALLLLILPVGSGLAVLAPYNSRADGAIALAIATGIALAVNRLLLHGTRRPDRPLRELAFQVSTVELALAPVLSGAILLTSGSDLGDLGHGLLGFGNLASIGVGILGGWVLLVEILR
jgi:modulator of FtsH protease